ncbi:MAG: HAMP domain-containing histidine kinase [Bifidobacteriaceae bacterium]|nr:HAMP domain-containing histidine kinase [Bifidobacteriaceae bacterium]
MDWPICCQTANSQAQSVGDAAVGTAVNAEFWLPLILAALVGASVTLALTGLARHIQAQRLRKAASPQVLPEDSMLTAAAFGGYALIVTSFHVVVYESELASTLPLTREGVLIHPQLADLADEAWTAQERITRPFQFENLPPLVHVVAQATVLDDRWVLLTLVDRTEEVHTREIRRDFISNFGHELRTPITSVALIAQALQAVNDDASQVAHFAQRLEEVAVRLETLTEDTIALSLVQDGGAHQRFAVVDFDQAVAQAHRHQLTAAEGAQIDLRWSKRTPASVWGDKAALATAVENLIANAIHYSPAGSRVTLTTRVDATEGTVAISVIDKGIGIDPADQDRVFERFYRADAARDARTGGTGLGLAIVKNTAQAHGGEITLVSKPGAGSTFTMTIPLLNAPTVTAQPKSKGSNHNA